MEKVALIDIHKKLQKEYDIFIVSSSFEERGLSVTRNINNQIKFRKKIVIAELNNRNCIQSNLDIFHNEFGFEIVETDSFDQLQTVDNLLFKINEVLKENDGSSFLIDITTFTRQNLLILIRLLRNNLSNNKNKVQCLYSIAGDYAIGLEEDEKWLSKGVMSVHSIFGYVGSMLPSRPYHLIILMGYEVERAASLIEAYEPSKITVGFASKESSLSDKHYALNKKRYENLLEEFPMAEKFEFSCSSIESVEMFLSQARKYPNHNVVITPMNNKISTLFLAAASFENKDIQLAIAIPMIYNYNGYSSPGNDCIIIDANSFLLKDELEVDI